VERLAISRSRLKPYHVLDICVTLADVVMGFDGERLFQDSPDSKNDSHAFTVDGFTVKFLCSR
jgi:hypothetical protein